MIDDGRNFIVRRNGKKFRAELLTFADINRQDAVIQLGLLHKKRDFMPVGGRGVVKVNHRNSCHNDYRGIGSSIGGDDKS